LLGFDSRVSLRGRVESREIGPDISVVDDLLSAPRCLVVQKSELMLSRSLSLRQAKVLIEMLRMGSFTVAEIASETRENERYIQNLICDENAAFKRYGLLIPVQNVKHGRVGAPPKVWAIDPDKQREILQRLEPYYEALEEQTAPRYSADTESVYRFLCFPTEQVEGTKRSAYSATISIQRRAGSVEVCTPVINRLSEIPDREDLIVVDPGKIASGLAALYQTRPNYGKNITAILNFRGGEAHFVFLRRGVLKSFSSTRLEAEDSKSSNRPVSLSIANQYLILTQLQAAINLHRAAFANENINEILVTGNLRSPSAICNIISRAVNIPCMFLDPTEALAFSSECSTQPYSRHLIMNCVPEIGYAFKEWLAEGQHKSRTSLNEGHLDQASMDLLGVVRTAH